MGLGAHRRLRSLVGGGDRKEPAMAGTEDRVEGKAKELEGKATGDEAREAEGKGRGLLGKAKDKASDTADSLRGRDGT